MNNIKPAVKIILSLLFDVILLIISASFFFMGIMALSAEGGAFGGLVLLLISLLPVFVVVRSLLKIFSKTSEPLQNVGVSSGTVSTTSNTKKILLSFCGAVLIFFFISIFSTGSSSDYWKLRFLRHLLSDRVGFLFNMFSPYLVIIGLFFVLNSNYPKLNKVFLVGVVLLLWTII